MRNPATLIPDHFSRLARHSGTLLGRYLARAGSHLNEPLSWYAYRVFLCCQHASPNTLFATRCPLAEAHRLGSVADVLDSPEGRTVRRLLLCGLSQQLHCIGIPMELQALFAFFSKIVWQQKTLASCRGSDVVLRNGYKRRSETLRQQPDQAGPRHWYKAT